MGVAGKGLMPPHIKNLSLHQSVGGLKFEGLRHFLLLICIHVTWMRKREMTNCLSSISSSQFWLARWLDISLESALHNLKACRTGWGGEMDPYHLRIFLRREECGEAYKGKLLMRLPLAIWGVCREGKKSCREKERAARQKCSIFRVLWELLGPLSYIFSVLFNLTKIYKYTMYLP